MSQLTTLNTLNTIGEDSLNGLYGRYHGFFNTVQHSLFASNALDLT